jgi:hypothetical protein
VQPVRRGQDEAGGGLVDHGAELAQRAQVEVDRPVADVAAAEVRDERVAEPVQQRAAEQDRDAAGAGMHVDLVDVGPPDVRRVEAVAAVLLADPYPVQLQEAADHLHVADRRDVVQGAGGIPEKGGHHRLRDEVLGTTNADLTEKRGTAVHAQNVLGHAILQHWSWDGTVGGSHSA